MQIKSRNIISKKDKRDLQEYLITRFGDSASEMIQKSFIIESAKTDEGLFYLNNGKIWFFIYDKEFLPSIHCLRESSLKLSKVIVDIGAIRFVTNGADIMAPGVVFFDETIEEGTIVAIHEEKANTIIGVGLSLINSKDFEKTKKGKIVKNIHYLTDSIWESRF